MREDMNAMIDWVGPITKILEKECPEYIKYMKAFRDLDFKYLVIVMTKLAIFTGYNFEMLMDKMNSCTSIPYDYLIRNIYYSDIHTLHLSEAEIAWLYKISCERIPYNLILYSYLENKSDIKNAKPILRYLLHESLIREADYFRMISVKLLEDILYNKLSTDEQNLIEERCGVYWKDELKMVGDAISNNILSYVFQYSAVLSNKDPYYINLSRVSELLNQALGANKIHNKSARYIFFGTSD